MCGTYRLQDYGVVELRIPTQRQSWACPNGPFSSQNCSSLRLVWKWKKQVSRRGNSLKMGDILPPFFWVQACVILSRLFFSWRSTWQWWLLNNHTLSHNINRKVITPQPNASRHALQQSFMWHYRRARPRGKGMVVGSIKQWTVTQETTVSIKILTTYQRGVFHVYYCNHDDKGPLSLMKK